MPEKNPKWIGETLVHLDEMIRDDESYSMQDILAYVRAKLIESFKNGVDTQKSRKKRPHHERAETERPSATKKRQINPYYSINSETLCLNLKNLHGCTTL